MIEYLIILLLSFPPLLWLRDGFILLGHDTGFRFDRWAQLPNLWYSWDPKNNFGVDWSMFKGFLVTQLPEVVFSTLTNSFAWGQKLSLVFWFAIMGIGMLVFLRSVFPERKYQFARVFSSIFYMYNFFILSGWQIGERAKFSLYAALPVGLLLVYNVFVRNRPAVRNGVLFGLVYFFLNGGGVLPLYGATFLVFGIAFVFFAWRKPFLFILKTLAAFLVPFLLLNAYYIFPNITLLVSNYGSSVGAQGGIEGLISWERVVSRDASFWNLIRLQGIPGEFGQYQTNRILILASLFPVFVILFGIIRFRLPRIIKLLLFILPFGLLLTMGTHPPTGILYELAMKKVPGFVMFRSSFYKFAPAVWFPMIVLTGYFLNERVRHRLVKLLLIVGLLAYHYPFFTTDMFAIGNGFSTRVQVPNYLQHITREMKQYVDHDDAVLIMPKMADFSPNLPADMYTWKYFGLDIFPRNAVNRRFIANDSQDPIVGRLYDALYAGDAGAFERVAGILGINYVLWRGDAIPSPDSPTVAKKVLDGYERVFDTGPWSLYRISETREVAVTATSQFRGYEATEAGGAYLTQRYDTMIHPGTDFLEAECMLCKENEYNKLVESINLPKTRIAPGSLFFGFERWRQNRLIASVKDTPKERIDADIALAQKYFSWGNADQASGFMYDALASWQTLTGRDRILYAIRLMAYLEAQKQPIPENLKKNIWMSESGMYRYIAPASEGYEIITSDPADKVTDSVQENLRFIEVRSTGTAPFVFLRKEKTHLSKESPNVTFRKLNPTKYVAEVTSDMPYVLMLKERFDPRWKISIPGDHVQVDGFANGWIIDKTGSYDVAIYYEPQKYFYLGLIITGISLIGSIYYVVKI